LLLQTLFVSLGVVIGEAPERPVQADAAEVVSGCRRLAAASTTA
jgi:hypothetical protein